MDQSTGLLSGWCGLGIVCSGLLLVAVFLTIRLTGRGLIPLVSMVLDRRATRKPVDVPIARRRRVDLRARAQSVDFDSALASARPDDLTVPPVATPPTAFTPQASPPDAYPAQTDSLPPADPNLPWRKGRRRGNEDEIYGGMLDRDGDGEVDF